MELHKIDCDASESQDKKKKTETQSTLQKSYGIVAKSSKKQSVCITADIAKMIVMDMHPPYMVQHDGFQGMNCHTELLSPEPTFQICTIQ